MPSEHSSEVKFEIGHVLFIDIVGYSKLLINEQSEQIQKLKLIVRGTEQFRLAEAEGKLLRLPTGDGGAILLSRRVAEDLKHYARWRPYLHEIGECKVKHGEIISLVNFYTEELGNAQRPQNIRGAAPAKSVAVLPFVSMSADKHDEYLSDGMTEELINALARVPGLRVPGRTSCFAFKVKNEKDNFH